MTALVARAARSFPDCQGHGGWSIGEGRGGLATSVTCVLRETEIPILRARRDGATPCCCFLPGLAAVGPSQVRCPLSSWLDGADLLAEVVKFNANTTTVPTTSFHLAINNC